MCSIMCTATAAAMMAALPLQSPIEPTSMFEFVRYAAPTGWAAQEVQEGRSYVRPDGTGVIVLHASRPDGAPALDAFHDLWRLQVQPAVGATAPEPEVGQEGEVTIAVGARQVGTETATITASLVTFTRAGRTVGVVAVARSADALAELGAFFNSLGATSSGPDTLEPPRAPPETRGADAADHGDARVPIEPGTVIDGRPAGLFYRVEVDVTGSRGVETSTWLFLPNGRVSRFHPMGGSGLFEPSRCNPDTCGSFEARGGELVMRWDNGTVHSWTLAVTADGVRLDGREFRRARSIRAQTLVGEWSDGRAGLGGANLYTFGADGRFTFGTASSGLDGTWRLDGLTLTLTFADGDVRGRTIFGASSGVPEGLISVDGTVFARR